MTHRLLHFSFSVFHFPRSGNTALALLPRQLRAQQPSFDSRCARTIAPEQEENWLPSFTQSKFEWCDERGLHKHQAMRDVQSIVIDTCWRGGADKWRGFEE